MHNFSVKERLWRLKPSDERQALALAQHFNLPLIIASLLTQRGITLEHAAFFLEPKLKDSLPDPSSLQDLDKAVSRLIHAIENKEKIAIFGDYDVDGATSSALLSRYFSALGVPVTIYIPDRILEGYGPNTQALLKLAQDNVRVVITVDCGTTAFEPLEAARAAGLDTIIIDHHIPESKHPPVVALVNPNRLDESGEWGYLAAVGVCFLFLVGLNRGLRQRGFFKGSPYGVSEPDLTTLLDLVALGTVCDVVPLKGLNRAFVARGLDVMRHRRNLGLKTLMDVAGVRECPEPYHLGFTLGPRINAGGRIGTSRLGVDLLTTEDPVEATRLAQTLDQFNRERQRVEQTVLEEAIEQVHTHQKDTPILVVSSVGWHPGVIGIVASRLKEQFNRPALVVSFEEENTIGKGSGRSVVGLDLGSYIQGAKQKGLLVNGGGHMMAAGFSVAWNQLGAFHQFLQDRFIQSRLQISNELSIDAFLTLKGASLDFVKILKKLSPYGQGNPSPRFLFEHVQILKSQIVGKNHVRCLLTDKSGGRLFGTAFQSAESPLGEALLTSGQRSVHLVGTLKSDSWMGEERVQLTIEDLSFEKNPAFLYDKAI